jgi:hypothetical protein
MIRPPVFSGGSEAQQLRNLCNLFIVNGLYAEIPFFIENRAIWY